MYTIKETPLEAWTKVRDWFSRPNAAFAVDPHSGDCVYRTSGGNRCALGVLIPDEVYEKEFEGIGVVALPLKFRHPETFDLMHHVQSLHDHGSMCSTIEDFLVDLDLYRPD